MVASAARLQRRDVWLIIGLALALVVLWQIPMFGLLLYPFRLFGTFVHELSHGLTAIITGGQFQRFEVRTDLSGVAWSAGGLRWIVSSAGYVGSAVFGALLLLLATSGFTARRVLLWLGMALGLLCLLFVRNLFGIVSGLALATALVFAAQRLNPRWAFGLLLLLAVQLMLDSIDSLFTLINLSASSFVVSDAQIMAQSTGIPALFWAVSWMLISLSILAFTLRLTFRRAR